MIRFKKIKKSKFNNIKLTVDGEKFDSKLEAEKLLELKQLEKAGIIKDLKFKTKYQFVINGQPLTYVKSKRPIIYTDDASFFDIELNKHRVIDVKGVETPIFKLKQALMYRCNNVVVEVWKKS